MPCVIKNKGNVQDEPHTFIIAFQWHQVEGNTDSDYLEQIERAGGTVFVLFEPPHDKTNKSCTPSEDSDQPGHWSSLIKSLGCALHG